MAGVKGMRDKLLKSPERIEQWRASVRIGLIRNRLMKHFLGELELSATQLKAAEILIARTVPAMASVEQNVQVEHRYAARVPEPIQDADKWQKQHTPPSIQTLQ